MKRRAFTMIELMTVIGIIAILGSILIIGVGKLQTSAKRRQTEQVLANCQSLLAEYDASQRISFRNAGNLPCPQNVTDEYYGAIIQSGKDPTAAVANADRYGEAVLLTRDILFQLKAMPSNAVALSKMPVDVVLAIPGPKTPPTVFPSSYFMPAPSAWATGSTYAVGKRVTDSNTPKNTYASIQNSNSTTGPPSAGYWILEPATTISVPVLLDAWGNPIIFVPSGLGVGATWTGTGAIPVGELGAGGRAFTAASSDNRPFFASAGPDGDFSKGDDNLYSFEK